MEQGDLEFMNPHNCRHVCVSSLREMMCSFYETLKGVSDQRRLRS